MIKKTMTAFTLCVGGSFCALTLSACVRMHADAKTDALFKAAKTNNVAEARRLIADGADVNAKSYLGLTVLMVAAGNNFVDVARLLLAVGADVDAADNYGETALLYALKNKSRDVTRLLLADVIELFEAAEAQ